MALIECSECGQQVSSKAASCPGCGAPISEKSSNHVSVTRTGAKWEMIGVALILVGLITGMATGESNHVGGILSTIGFVLFLYGRFK